MPSSSAPANPVEITVVVEDSLARLSVRDRGIGIAEADQARVFQRFERAQAAGSYEGFGIGLWMVREIAEALGGRVDVVSELGAGSTVELPRRRSPPAP